MKCKDARTAIVINKIAPVSVARNGRSHSLTSANVVNAAKARICYCHNKNGQQSFYLLLIYWTNSDNMCTSCSIAEMYRQSWPGVSFL